MIAGIVTGIGLALAAIGFIAFTKDKGWTLAWWQWLLLALAAPILLLGVGALGTSLAEETAAAGWVMFGLAALVALILGFAALRPVRSS
ncbi:MAG: hypothetical protein ACLFWD_11155 [Anaerolineales bacterium]